MAKNEQKRINLLKKIRADKNTIMVKDVEEIFTSTLFLLLKETKTFARIKEKLGEAEMNCMVHSLANSFLTSLYCNAGKTKAEQLARTKEASEVNNDLLAAVYTTKSHK